MRIRHSDDVSRARVNRVRELTAFVRRHTLVLMCAVNEQNADFANVVAIRVRDALEEAQRLAAGERNSEVSGLVLTAARTASPWLKRVARTMQLAPRTRGALDASPEFPTDLCDRDVTGAVFEHLDIGGMVVTNLCGQGAAIRIAMADGARLAHCELISCELGRSTLDGCVIEHCRFDHSSLEATSWFTTETVGCSFLGASFVDSRLDQVVFRDCDFQGADFSIVDSTMPDAAVRALFVRCDLRNTRWSRRSLSECHFFECKFYAAHGAPFSTEHVEIVRPDLSRQADRSKIGTARDVLAMWHATGLH